MDFTGCANPLYLGVQLNNGLHAGMKYSVYGYQVLRSLFNMAHWFLQEESGS
jgi:hypothetical protein